MFECICYQTRSHLITTSDGSLVMHTASVEDTNYASLCAKEDISEREARETMATSVQNEQSSLSERQDIEEWHSHCVSSNSHNKGLEAFPERGAHWKSLSSRFTLRIPFIDIMACHTLYAASWATPASAAALLPELRDAPNR